MYLLESTKVPFIYSHAHHAHVLLFLPYTVLSQSLPLRLLFIHYSVFSLPPTLSFDWNLCLALSIITYVHYIWHDQNVFQADHYFIPLHLDMYLKDQPFILWHYTGLGLVPLLSSGMLNYRLAS